MLAVHNILGLITLVVPVDANVVTTIHNELVATTSSWVPQPPSQVLLVGELVDVRGLVGLVDATLPAISLDIGHLVHAHGVLLVKRSLVELTGGGRCLAWG